MTTATASCFEVAITGLPAIFSAYGLLPDSIVEIASNNPLGIKYLSSALVISGNNSLAKQVDPVHPMVVIINKIVVITLMAFLNRASIKSVNVVKIH